ncbi:Uncharacterised protein [Acinetobacter baumannii]|nr:Uncharacterised protein [Acinetobacter baumannii]
MLCLNVKVHNILHSCLFRMDKFVGSFGTSQIKNSSKLSYFMMFLNLTRNLIFRFILFDRNNMNFLDFMAFHGYNFKAITIRFNSFTIFR